MRSRRTFALSTVCICGALGLSLALAVAKTAEQCNAEYAANIDVIKAAHGTKAAYLAACRGGRTPDAAPEAATVAPEAPASAPPGTPATPAAPAAAPATPFGAPAAPATAPTAAEEQSPESNVSISVSSGKLTKIDAFFSLKPDCSSVGYADFDLKIDAKNGTFSAKRGNDRPKFPSNSLMAKCNRRYVPSSQLFYQSTKGYIGDDKVSVRIKVPTGDETNVIYNISVK